MKSTILELRQLLNELIISTESLFANYHPPNKNAFLYILEGIYRRNYFTLLAIKKLSSQSILGDKALDITRAMIEDTVAVEYMIAKGKRRLAKKFLRFIAVQLNQEIHFYKEMGQDPVALSGVSAVDIKDIIKKYQRVKKEFTHKPTGSDLHSWIGKDVDRLLVELKIMISSGNKKIKLTTNDITQISRGYIYGNRKNHTNPLDVLSFMKINDHKSNTLGSLRMALAFASTCFIRLTTRYIDEIRFMSKSNDYEDVAIKVKKLFKKMNN